MNRLLLLTYMDVLETRNFNRTAERLNVTQSTVSARIRQLEDDIGSRLFERGRGGADPTAAGRRFETHCRSLLAAWSLAKRDVTVGDGRGRSRLRISVQLNLPKRLLVDWSTAVRAEVPRLDLYLEGNFSEQIQRDIQMGDADIGIMFAPQQFPDVAVTEFASERYYMVSTCCQTLEEVPRSRYIKVAFTSYFDRHHDERFPELAHVDTVVGSDALAAEFLRAGGGTTYVPSLALDALRASLPELQVIRDAPVIPQPLYAITHTRRRRDKLTMRAIGLLQQSISDALAAVDV